jgi:hypothetical protein
MGQIHPRTPSYLSQPIPTTTTPPSSPTMGTPAHPPPSLPRAPHHSCLRKRWRLVRSCTSGARSLTCNFWSQEVPRPSHLQAREPGGAPSLTSQPLEPDGAPSVTSQPRVPAGFPSSLATTADRLCGAGGRRGGFLPCTARRPIQLHLVDAADATPPLSQLLPIPPPRAQRRNPRRPRQGASSNSSRLPA